MSFRLFLESAEDIEALLPEIQKNCQFYLGMGKPYYRGMKGYGDAGIKTARKDRKPRDTHKILSDFINVWLKENGVAPRSEGVFCYPTEHGIQEFGESKLIFPVGKYDAYYLDGISDLTMDMKLEEWDSDIKIYHATIEKEITDGIKSLKTSKDAIKLIDDVRNAHEPLMDNSKSNKEVLKALKNIKIRFNKVTKKKIVKNNLSRVTNEEIVLNCDKYYYISVVAMNSKAGLHDKVIGLFK